MAVTRSDVARAAGVSPAVVSYVLNGGPRPASAQAHTRVLEAVSRLGYRPNAIASALRGGSTQTIGFLNPNRSNPFFGELAEALELYLNDHGYLVLGGSTYGNRASEERLLLARELHDVLAHNVSLMNVQASTALHLFDEDPERLLARCLEELKRTEC